MATTIEMSDIRRRAFLLPNAVEAGSRFRVTSGSLLHILRVEAARAALRLFDRLLPYRPRPLHLLVWASGYSEADIGRCLSLLSDESLVENWSDPECVSEVLARRLAGNGLIRSSEPGYRTYTPKGCTMLYLKDAMGELYIVQRWRAFDDLDDDEYYEVLRRVFPPRDEEIAACGGESRS